MHVIPSLIPEAVLGTKEPSEKARTAAFDVVVAMGKKMHEGGVVKRNLIDGMDEDGPAEDGALFFSSLRKVTYKIAFESSRQHSRVHDNGCWRPRRRQPAYD